MNNAIIIIQITIMTTNIRIYNDLNDESPKICQPKNMTIELMAHQKTIIYAMKKLEENGLIDAHGITQYNHRVEDFSIDTNIAILADRVGAGKSLMIIGLINLLKQSPRDNVYWFGSRYLCIKSKHKLEIMNTTLLIVPHKITSQWIKFFKYAPNIKLGTFINIHDEKLTPNVEAIKKCKYDVILLSCTKSTAFFQKFGNIKWARIIVDEADSIILSSITTLGASFVWLITATPERLRYTSKKYLAGVLTNILPWAFEYLLVKNNQNYLEESIILPTPRRYIIECLTSKTLIIIQNIIPSNILEMINAGNTKEAIVKLNCNIDTDDNILKVITKNIQDTIMDKEIELAAELKKKFRTKQAKIEQRERICKLSVIIKRLNVRYESIKEKIYSLNDEICPICMDNFTTPTLVNCCKNLFCFECISLSINGNNCPYCKQYISKKDLFVIENKIKTKIETDDIRQTLEINQKKEKIDAFLDIIKAKPTGKFLVFANYHATFKKIKNILHAQTITFGILKGHTDKVNRIIGKFSDGLITVLMLNAKFFGAGMNLQMATDVIMYHRFDREMEEQIIGRAQRLGRTAPLNIFYLINGTERHPLNENREDYEDRDFSEWLINDENRDNIHNQNQNQCNEDNEELTAQTVQHNELNAVVNQQNQLINTINVIKPNIPLHDIMDDDQIDQLLKVI